MSVTETLLRLTSSKGDVMWIGVHDDPRTGKREPMAEVTIDSVDMWMAIADGVAVMVEAETGDRVVLAPLYWIEKNFSAEATSGLDRIRETLRDEKMLP